MKNKIQKKSLNKKAQQEIVGFVLIVVLVVVALMVYLVISLRTTENTESLEVENILDTLMKHTTECAITYEPDYDNVQDLFKSAHQGKTCSNIDEPALDYLNETLRDVLDAMFATEATVGGYEVEFYEDDADNYLIHFVEGSCTGTISSAQKSLVSNSKDIIIKLKICVT